jgi:hypothetical protein
MSQLDQEYFDFYEYQRTVEAATAALKQANMMQNKMHFQFGEPEWYQQFEAAVKEASGWISSHC